MSREEVKVLQRIDEALIRIRGSVEILLQTTVVIRKALQEIDDACKQLDRGAEK